MSAPSVETLQAEANRLILPQFTEQHALALGQILTDLATAQSLPVVINIRTASRTLFHAAMPGSAALHDLWATRKSNTALLFQEASLLVGTRNRDKNETLAKHGLDSASHADHGGAVPIRVAGVGMVAVVTVSGLPQIEDHRLAVQALDRLIATK